MVSTKDRPLPEYSSTQIDMTNLEAGDNEMCQALGIGAYSQEYIDAQSATTVAQAQDGMDVDVNPQGQTEDTADARSVAGSTRSYADVLCSHVLSLQSLSSSPAQEHVQASTNVAARRQARFSP